MTDGAETAVRNACFQLDDRWMKPSRIGDAQHYSGPLHSVECGFRALQVERERLFHENVLAGRGGALDLPAVLAVRRRKHDPIDCRVGEDLAEIILQRYPVLGTEGFGRSAGASMTGREADCAALA